MDRPNVHVTVVNHNYNVNPVYNVINVQQNLQNGFCSNSSGSSGDHPESEIDAETAAKVNLAVKLMQCRKNQMLNYRNVKKGDCS